MFTISSVPQVVYCFSQKANWFNWFHGNQRPTNFSSNVPGIRAPTSVYVQVIVCHMEECNQV